MPGMATLYHLSPLLTLSPGYSIIESLSTHEVIRSQPSVYRARDSGSSLAKGRLRCTVQEILSDPSV